MYPVYDRAAKVVPAIPCPAAHPHVDHLRTFKGTHPPAFESLEVCIPDNKLEQRTCYRTLSGEGGNFKRLKTPPKRK